MTRAVGVLFLGLCLLVSVHGRAWSQTVDLPPVNDPSLTFLLSNMEIISEIGLSDNRNMAYFLRIIRVSDEGECNGTPQSCPKRFIYIAISSIDEYPDKKLFRLPDAHGWEFSSWDYLPRHQSPEEFVMFTMSRKVVAKDITKRWWSQEFYTIKVNVYSATMEKIK